MRPQTLRIGLVIIALLCTASVHAQVNVLHFGNRLDPNETYATRDRVDRIMSSALDASGAFSVMGYTEAMNKAAAGKTPDPETKMINISMNEMMQAANATFGITGDLRRFGRLIVHDVLVQHKDSMMALIEGYGYAIADDSSMTQMDSAAIMATMRGIAAALPSVKPYAKRKEGPAVMTVTAVAIVQDPQPQDTSFAARALREALSALAASPRIVVITRDLLQEIATKANAGIIGADKLTAPQALALNKQRIRTTLQATASAKGNDATVTLKWVVVAEDGLTYDVGSNTCTVVRGKDNKKAISGLVADAVKSLTAQ